MTFDSVILCQNFKLIEDSDGNKDIQFKCTEQ